MSLASPCQFHEPGHAIAPTSPRPATMRTSDKVSAPSRGKPSSIDAQSTSCVVLLCVTLSVWSALGGRWNEEEGQ